MIEYRSHPKNFLCSVIYKKSVIPLMPIRIQNDSVQDDHAPEFLQAVILFINIFNLTEVVILSWKLCKRKKTDLLRCE